MGTPLELVEQAIATNAELAEEIAHWRDLESQDEDGEYLAQEADALAGFRRLMDEMDAQESAVQNVRRPALALALALGWLQEVTPETREAWWTARGEKKEPVFRLKGKMYRLNLPKRRVS